MASIHSVFALKRPLGYDAASWRLAERIGDAAEARRKAE
jgi:hypothetical protein